MIRILGCVLPSALVWQFSFAQSIPTSEMTTTTVRTEESMKIDGILSEGVWQRPGFTGIVQQEPDQYAAPTQQSEIWYAYENDAIYFAAKYRPALQ